jgi:hypothetical protein
VPIFTPTGSCSSTSGPSIFRRCARCRCIPLTLPPHPLAFASAVLVCVALIPLVDSVSRQQFHAKRRVLAPNSPFCDHSCRQLQPCRCKRAIAGLVTRHWHLQPPGVPCDSSRRGCRVRLQPASVWPSSHFSARSLGVLCVHLSQFSADFARDLIAARVPFGRLLDEHHVKRVVQVGRTCKACVCLPHFTSWRVWAGPCSNPVSRAGNVGSSTWPPSSHVHCKRRAPLLRIRWRRRPLPVGTRRAHAAARHGRRCGALQTWMLSWFVGT